MESLGISTDDVRSAFLASKHWRYNSETEASRLVLFNFRYSLGGFGGDIVFILFWFEIVSTSERGWEHMRTYWTVGDMVQGISVASKWSYSVCCRFCGHLPWITLLWNSLGYSGKLNRTLFTLLDSEHKGLIDLDEHPGLAETFGTHLLYLRYLFGYLRILFVVCLFVCFGSQWQTPHKYVWTSYEVTSEPRFVSGCMQLHGPAKSMQMAKMSYENKRTREALDSLKKAGLWEANFEMAEPLFQVTLDNLFHGNLCFSVKLFIYVFYVFMMLRFWFVG